MKKSSVSTEGNNREVIFFTGGPSKTLITTIHCLNGNFTFFVIVPHLNVNLLIILIPQSSPLIYWLHRTSYVFGSDAINIQHLLLNFNNFLPVFFANRKIRYVRTRKVTGAISFPFPIYCQVPIVTGHKFLQENVIYLLQIGISLFFIILGMPNRIYVPQCGQFLFLKTASNIKTVYYSSILSCNVVLNLFLQMVSHTSIQEHKSNDLLLQKLLIYFLLVLTKTRPIPVVAIGSILLFFFFNSHDHHTINFDNFFLVTVY